MPDDPHNIDENNAALRMQLHALYQRLNETGIKVDIETNRPFAEQLAQLQNQLLVQFECCHVTVRALKESEERNELVNWAANDIIWEWRLDSGKIRWSKSVEEVVGRTLPEVPDTIQGWQVFIHPDDRERMIAGIRQAIASGQKFWSDEFRFGPPGGPYRHYLDRGVISRDEHGKAYRIIGSMLDLSETKRFEAALQTSEERFRQLADAMPLLVWTANPDGQVDYANRWYDEYAGYTKTEKGIIHWLPVLHPDDMDATRRAWAHAVKTGEPYKIEHRVRRADGSFRWHITSAAPIRNTQGEIIKWYGSSTDVHEWKEALEALKQSEVRMRLAQHVARISTFELNIQTNELHWSPEMEKLYGLRPGEFGGTYEAWLELVHPADRESAGQSVLASISGGGFETEWRVIWPDGTLHWIAARGQVFKDQAGKPLRMIGINMDITEQKQAEEAQKLAAMVYEDSSEGMLVTDEHVNIISVNRAFTQITGYEPAEVIGKNPSILRSGYHDYAFFADMWKRISTEGCFKGEIWNRKKNGEYFAAQLTIDTIRLKDSEPHRYVALMSDITEKKKSDDLIWLQANFDNLTGLPNRRLFRDLLQQHIKKSRRSKLPLALMFMDLDGFKDVNDTLGHDTGDLLLKEAALRLQHCMRDSDTVARLGGDEFTVILTEISDPRNVDRIARHILHALNEPFQLGEELAYVSASIGITLFPNDAADVENLIRNADQAMYSAKHEGKNRYHYFTPSMQEAAIRRMSIVNDMRGALDANQFEIVYQPIVDLRTGIVRKAEALIRWQHPRKGLISPAEFISAAEDTGMIASFGNWVFREAALQAANWREHYQAEFQISVNISPVQFKKEGIDSSAWLERLAELNLAGQGVVVEITEGLLLEASPKVIEQLLKLRDAGIEVALDDFGTGYSSLAYLKKFHIDYLKIDRAFVHNLKAGSDDMALSDAIIVMAHKLGMKVIAEGVETEEQRNLLAEAGCDFAQGYLFSRPVSKEGFEQLLRAAAPFG